MTPEPPDRPEDVDTAFWLWAVALPLLVTSYLTDVVTAPTGVPIVIAFAVFVAIILVAVVGTFLVLMRAGYRWARTVLTAGGLSSIVYVTMNLFGTQRSEFGATIYAVTGIFGAVLVAGGIYLLHRRTSHAYFTR
ncbi:hypothetical protein [[Mycobacterium] burgundiense]|uniref:Transmembrane protein n=1 Tax=[Mycobacterium] burgundiense TaxID=3064286 RepID=A0ABN9NM09_9MYCO|nr:hypothetical protein [Mycolicibacterium sp. MU0053]CAJ1508832.1 hypothetical protein MU0053_003982 [Mycolicibacterium sp. MU0053]